MVEELQEFILQDKVFFGIKQSLKNSSRISKVIVPKDCREDIRKLLKVNKLGLDVLDFGKEEIYKRLGMKFQCEVFGVRK